MHFSRPKNEAQPFEGAIRYEGRDLFVKAEILPAKKAPHVSADSPRHMEPGRRAEVLYYSLHDNLTGDDVTVNYCFDAVDREITDLIRTAWVLDCMADRIAERGGAA